MSKKEIEPKLAKLMDIVPECEGLIAANATGKVIVGQTLTEMDHAAIAKSCAAIIKDSNALGKTVGKGSSKATTIELDEGFAVLVGNDKLVLIALAGVDGKASSALLKRNLISIL
jgi:predicted regulator of Ras-like GTPase activity (Roadblock/LC7/MglB family)